MATPTKTTKSTPSASVKATQTALNKAGANLKVDGILGPKTIAAQQQYGSTTTSSPSKSAPTSTNKSTPAIKVSSGSKSSGSKMSTPAVVSSTSTKKASKFGNPFEGGFFNNLKTGVKDAINNVKNIASTQPASAVLSGKLLDGYTDSNGVYHSTNVNPSGTYETPSFASKITGGPLQAPVVGTAEKPIVANNKPTALDAEGNYYTTTGGPVSNPDGTTMNIKNVQASPTPTSTSGMSSQSSGGTTVSKTVTTDPNTGAVNTMTETSPASTPTVQINQQVTSAVTGLTDSLKGEFNTGNAWDKNSRGEFQASKVANYEQTLAGYFSTPQSVDNQYNSDSVFRSKVSEAAKLAGKSDLDMINSIKGKVQVATNGIVPPQGTGEYLDLINTKNTPSSIKAEADLLNKEIIMTSQFNNSQDKLAYEILEQTKKDSQAILDSITRSELRKETSVREKAQYMIDKAKAEFDMKDAETEQNRISAMTNLTEFLAHIGALNTDGNSKLGIETLNQKYQAQRQALRTNFDLGVREIQMDMNDKINDLESNLEDDILKINMDLSKSEREVKMDSLKLRNDTNKAILKANQEYAQSLRQYKDKQETKALSYSNQYNETLWKLMSKDNIPADVAKKMINSKGEMIPSQQNLDTFNSYKPQDIGITDTTMQKVRQYLKQENGKDIASYEEDLKAFNSDAEFRNSILGSLE